MIALTDALASLRTAGNATAARKAAKVNKVDRAYLGVSPKDIDALCKDWRNACDLDARIDLAIGLWDSAIFDARMAAAKLLVQMRISPDDRVWDTLLTWVTDCDCVAITDQVSTAGQKRLVADITRLDALAPLVEHDSKWVRRAALMMTQAWAKQNHPKPADMAARDRVLDWAATLAPQHDVDVQKAIAAWVRILSKHAPDLAADFLQDHHHVMNPQAVAEARIHMPDLVLVAKTTDPDLGDFDDTNLPD